MMPLRPTLLASMLVGLGCAAGGDPDVPDPGATGGQSGSSLDARGPSSGGGAPGSGGGAPGSGGARAEGGAGGSPGSGGSSGSGGARAEGGSGGSSPTPVADAGSPAGDASAADAGAPTPSAGLEKIFDGKGWDNWEYDPKAWTIVDGAMHGMVGSGQSQAYTKKDYSNFRLIVWSRMPQGNDHLGICFWGSRPAAGKYGFGGCLLVIPPNAAIWDYSDNTDHPKPDYQKGQTEWHRTEILANRQTGRVLVAVNGRLIHDYQDPPTKLPRRKASSIGMQIHKAGTVSEYKDIEIEVDPKSDKLITVMP
jgi:hypothetical protein